MSNVGSKEFLDLNGYWMGRDGVGGGSSCGDVFFVFDIAIIAAGAAGVVIVIAAVVGDGRVL